MFIKPTELVQSEKWQRITYSPYSSLLSAKKYRNSVCYDAGVMLKESRIFTDRLYGQKVYEVFVRQNV